MVEQGHRTGTRPRTRSGVKARSGAPIAGTVTVRFKPVSLGWVPGSIRVSSLLRRDAVRCHGATTPDRSLSSERELTRRHSAKETWAGVQCCDQSVRFRSDFGIIQVPEPKIVESLVAHGSAETPDEDILVGHTRLDRLQINAALVGPTVQYPIGELGFFVGSYQLWIPWLGGQPLQAPALVFEFLQPIGFGVPGPPTFDFQR